MTTTANLSAPMKMGLLLVVLQQQLFCFLKPTKVWLVLKLLVHFYEPSRVYKLFKTNHPGAVRLGLKMGVRSTALVATTVVGVDQNLK